MSTGGHVEGRHLNRLGSSGPYKNRREITKRFDLKPGEYIVIPSTYEADVETEFLLRFFSEKPLRGIELKQKTFGNFIIFY